MIQEYEDILKESPAVKEYLAGLEVKELTPVSSRWRSDNDIFILRTATDHVVLKKINQPTFKEEIDHQEQLARIYPGFVPKVLVRDDPTFVMEYATGRDLLDLCKKERFDTLEPLMRSAGVHLFGLYQQAPANGTKASGIHQIPYTDKYQRFGRKELRPKLHDALSGWESVLESYPRRVIHNDLNSANLRIDPPTGQVNGIDSRADVSGIYDLAKDLGRSLASMISATHDNRFRPEHSIEMGDAILDPWEEFEKDLQKRTAFYVGQSYLSFSRWDCDRLAGEPYFEIGVNLLKRGPDAYPDLHSITVALMEEMVEHAKEKDDLTNTRLDRVV